MTFKKKILANMITFLDLLHSSLPLARHIYASLVLVQPGKTHPCLNERLLRVRKESNQTIANKAFISKGMILNYLTYFLSKTVYDNLKTMYEKVRSKLLYGFLSQ